MMRFAFPLIAILITGCAESPARFEAARDGRDIAIAPYSSHEECIPLERGERIEFRFRSNPPVSFNIHYLEANAVIVPVTRDNATDEAGDFTAVSAQIHCLVWEAAGQGSVLGYRIRPLPPPH